MLLCCCGECVFIDDEFVRDSTGSTYGTTWSVESGTWNIVENTVTGLDDWGLSTSSAGARILVSQQAVGRRHAIQVSFRSIASGAIPRIYWGWQDTNNHYYADILNGVAALIYQRATGFDTQVATIFDENLSLGFNAETFQEIGANDYTIVSARSSRTSPTWVRTSSYRINQGLGTNWRRIGVGTSQLSSGEVQYNHVRGLNRRTNKIETCYEDSLLCGRCLDNLLPQTVDVEIDGPDAVTCGRDGVYSLVNGRGLNSYGFANVSCIYTDPTTQHIRLLLDTGTGYSGARVDLGGGFCSPWTWRETFSVDTPCRSLSGVMLTPIDGQDATCTITATS